MATGNSILNFDIEDVSGGCNYSDDLTALKKNQSPNSINVEFFNGRIQKRSGELAISTPPTGQGGIDSYTKLLLHMDGTAASTTFTDSENTPKVVTANGQAQLTTTKSKFGGASGVFGGVGIDTSTVLLLHMEGADTSTTFTDSALTPNTVTANGGAQISTSQFKFGTSSGLFDGVNGTYLSIPNSAAWSFAGGDFTMDFWVKATVSGSLSWLIGQTDLVGNNAWSCQWNADGTLFFGAQDLSSGSAIAGYTTTSSITLTDSFHHIAFVRSTSNFYIFVDGVSQPLSTSTAISTNVLSDCTEDIAVGQLIYSGGSRMFTGYMDELRVSNGVARWTANFFVPVLFYSTGDYLTLVDSADWNLGATDFTLDFWVNLNSVTNSARFISQGDDVNNYWQFYYSSVSGLVFECISASVTLARYSAAVSLTAGTFYHVAVVRSTTNIYMFLNGVKLTVTTSVAISTSTLPNLAAVLDIAGVTFSTGSFLNGYLDELRISKGIARWSATFIPPSLAYDTFNSTSSVVGFSIFDFSDVNQHHQQITHIGNTIYAFDRLTNVRATLRSGAPSIRSFNSKVSSYAIQTYNDHSVPYYWDGSAATMAILSGNAPGFRRCIEYQGYLIGMDITSAHTRCYYQLIGNIIGGGAAYTDYFTLTPSPNDDAITDPFLLNGRLYIGTNYGIFRISFVGGVTVFEFKQVISNVGIVPNTAQTVVTKDYGQVVLFLGTDKRIYLFDGANIKIVSDLFYYHNAATPIALDLIDDNYKENAFAVYDITKRVYRLAITKKASSMNYYLMNLDVDTFAYYPYDNMSFSAGALCYDEFLRPFVVFVDYTGILHKMFIDYPTDNGTPIDEFYTSPVVSKKSQVTKIGETITIHAKPVSNANLLVYEKVDFSRGWRLCCTLPLGAQRDKYLGRSFVLGSSVLGSEKDLIYPQISLANTFNDYQFMLVSDTPSSPSWEISDIEVNQTLLKFGRAEAQR